MKFSGVNIHGQGVKNRPSLIEWHRVNQPSWALVMDDLSLAREIKAVTPNTQVIVRQYMPDGFWYAQSPEEFLAFTDREGVDSNLWVYVENEAGLNVDWNVRLIQLNAKREHPRKLVILNLSVGSWSVQQWISAAQLLQLCDQYRDMVVIGLHEYWNVVPTSGLIGGYPDNAGAQPNLMAQPGTSGRNLIPAANWPVRPEVLSMTKFHCGRFEFINQACQQVGLKPPRLVLTEHGQDDVRDIEQWVGHSVGIGIRGYKTLQDYWHKTYPEWTLGKTYYEMHKYLRNQMYAGSNVEGALFYCCGHIDPKWEGFDIEGSELMSLLTADTFSPIRPTQEVAIVPNTTPTPLPAPQPAPIIEPPKPIEIKPIVTVTPGGNYIVEPIEDRNWKFVFEVSNISKSEAETLMKLFPSMSAHIEQVKVA